MRPINQTTDIIRLIDVPRAAQGALAHVIADSQARKGICYLE
ncbi:MAG: hypothetical protein ACYC7E_15250 [Armatimonadota bacterium]